MRHFFVVSGQADDVADAVGRLANYLAGTYGNPVTETHRLGEGDHSLTLLVAGSRKELMPVVCVDDSSGSWLVGVGALLSKQHCADLSGGALADLCRAQRPQDHPVIDQLDAAFCIAAGAVQTGHYRVVTDRIGTQHVFAGAIGQCSVLATSSLALAQVSQPGWNETAVGEFLATGSNYGTRTLFCGIDKLPAASVVSIGPTGIQRQDKYWSIAECDEGSDAPAVEQMASAIKDTIVTATDTLGHPVISLTGGLDSRIIFAAALEAGVSFDVFTTGSTQNADVVIAREIAATHGITHHHLPPAIRTGADVLQRSLLLSDGGQDVIEYARTLQFHEQLCGKFDFSINGSGGEFCKGYWWELLWPRVGARQPLNIAKIVDRRFLVHDWYAALPGTDNRENIKAALIETIRQENRDLQDRPNTMQLDNVYLTLRMQRWQGRIASATGQIWPTVSPFMFRRPMEIAFATVPKERLRNRMSRRLNEYLSPALARMRIDAGGPALPLRLQTAHLFWPSLLAATRKNFGKAGRRLSGGAHDMPQSPQSQPAESCAGLAGFSQVADWRTLKLYDAAALAAFTAPYLAGERPLDKPFGRLLTLEMTARHAGI
ncbi:MAG: hypothetical protein HKN06_06040 [Gammaproteobacteria bacterium]|nr:hypothetical protein [Gammaproteobacteria bacterium]